MLAKLASFTTMYKPNIITTPHKIARTKCCSDRSRASSLSKTDFFGGAAPFFHSFLRISISRICPDCISRPSDAVQHVSPKRFIECYFKAILRNLPKSLRHFRTLFRSFQNLIEKSIFIMT